MGGWQSCDRKLLHRAFVNRTCWIQYGDPPDKVINVSAAPISCWTATWWQSWETLVWLGLHLAAHRDAQRLRRWQLVKQRQLEERWHTFQMSMWGMESWGLLWTYTVLEWWGTIWEMQSVISPMKFKNKEISSSYCSFIGFGHKTMKD